jgi:hypothetical protein
MSSLAAALRRHLPIQPRSTAYALVVRGGQDGAPWREAAVGDHWDARHLALSGLERLHAEIDGRIPMAPLTRLTGCRPTDGGVGTATFSMPATTWLSGMAGSVTSIVQSLSPNQR